MAPLIKATWGADPLEYVGGFRNLSYDPKATFRSSLPTNGTATWNLTKAVQSSSPTSANASLSISYSNVDWDFLKTVYGWAAVQYQAWARGELIVGGNSTQPVILHTDSILEYWINGTHYFGGDYYSFQKAPLVIHLRPGTHKIDLRLVRDVRAFGGIGEPTIDVVLDVQQVSGTLELAKPGILMSDIVDGRLATGIGSVSLRNSGVSPIEIVVSQELNHVSIYRPHKITFLHPGGMVSYAMLRAPAKNATCQVGQKMLPILLALHGAGLEADSTMVTSALDPVSNLCAWVLFPTGVTPWSGDDWHNWGFADVEAAINTIPTWIQNVGWNGYGVDIERWIVSGHSNGGQATWYTLTHRPDFVLAAAPVSGYASIQKYVPYELWQPADPRRIAVASASLNSYRHEMLMANVRGIPIQQQHGELDDNVPAYNSRFLSQQLYLSGTNSSYNEVKSQNHWWDTVMTTPELVDFYYKQTSNPDVLPRSLDEFSIVIGDPGDMGSKGGIKVTYLKDPGQYGRVDVKGHTIKTSNVLSLEFNPVLWNETVTVNGQALNLKAAASASRSWFSVYTSGNTWSIGNLQIENSTPQRHQRQLGSMTAILRTQGPFIIRHPGSDNTSHLALQISRNLHQYFQADTDISSSYTTPTNATGNVITLAIGSSLEDLQPDFSIRVFESGVSIRDHQGQTQKYGDEARGAAFLRPLKGGRLDLVLWGADYEGLGQAARIVPMLTGVGQPDFVVLGESAKWRGIEGALAIGFFDSSWEVTASSVVESG
ncbi:hypothetical protein N0V83_005745 [Neocucurbitaria cava]|uniref:Peptidase S9 prolyl oligopeptidase catalytic domain-containing protein n=1 Tax=Neocucurbitaria cava TaxID=798079 RepID=A0A9W8Y8F2_9PLEO|nr:hypothetical protein N0V83_005745 [Neocucurbitaria cava]